MGILELFRTAVLHVGVVIILTYEQCCNFVEDVNDFAGCSTARIGGGLFSRHVV
jgi:hypothetical protein